MADKPAGGGEKAGENKLAQGWSSLMGGLNERVRDAREKIQDNLQKSGKLDELGEKIDKLKENAVSAGGGGG